MNQSIKKHILYYNCLISDITTNLLLKTRTQVAKTMLILSKYCTVYVAISCAIIQLLIQVSH